MRLRALAATLRHGRRPVRFGSFGGATPVSRSWGYDRGTPVDRWYIERFLAAHREDVTGRVLEVKDSAYTDRFGQAVTERAVLDVDAANPNATHVADLAAADPLPAGHFDCFILTQTLQYVLDLRAAIGHVHRILRPGGVVLASLPVTSRLSPAPLTDYWRFTPQAAEALFGAPFGAHAVTVRGHGNVLAQVAFLEGLAAEDLEPSKLAVDDSDFPLLVTVRARKGPV